MTVNFSSSLIIFAELACPEEKQVIVQTSLSSFTVARRIDAMSNHLEDALAENISKFSNYSLAAISDTAQLIVLIRGVTNDFKIKEEFLDLESMKSTTTGEDLSQEVLKMTERFQLGPKNLTGLTTDGAPAMVEKHKRFCKKFLEVFGSQNIVLKPLLYPPENLSYKVLDGIDITKEVVQCVNYILCRGINHRQLKFF